MPRRTVLSDFVVGLTAALLLGAAGPSCSTTRETSSESTRSLLKPPISLPPNTCRIAGTIVAVLPPDSGKDAGPCASVPCAADVRVDSVMGYGAAFPYPLAAGSVVRIRFTRTLAPTRAMFPELMEIPASLGKGDKFTGDIEGAEGLPSAGPQSMRFSVTTYTKH